MIDDLNQALAGATVRTCYQPIVRMSDRAPIAIETLARLNDPERGTLQPGDFVPGIEDAGLGGDLTDLVISRAFFDMRAIDADPGRQHIDIAVNVPLDVLLRPDSLERMERAREKQGIPAIRVIVELTESRPAEDLHALGVALDMLRAAEYRAAIDDFGPLMTNHADLLDLPFSLIKFDHHLIAAASRPGFEADFVRCAIDAAHARGLSVVAEGVEDEAAWRRLRALGIDAAQGFWIGRPLLPGQIAAWRTDWDARAS